jgi:scyllo-inositol 2-dehydrogenase (NADP+)
MLSANSLSVNAPDDRSENMKEPVRVGVLGYGYAGRSFHAYLVGLEPRLRLTAIASRDVGRRERAAREHGVATFETLDGMLADGDVDLLIIATPHDVHARQAIQAMEAGKHVVVDKVMALSLEEADAMIAARDRNGVLMSVFHNRRWDGDFLTAQRAVQAGLLGRLLFLEIGIWRYGPPGNWRARRDQVGTIMHDWGAHFVDQALLLSPAPVTSVFARSQHEWPGIDVESYIGADIQFADGVFGRIEVATRARASRPRWYLVGDRGAFLKDGVDPQEAAMVRGEIDAAREDPADAARLVTELDGLASDMRLTTLRGDWRAYYRNIAEALLDNTPLAVKPEEVRRVVGVLEAVQRSADTGEVVRFPGGGL